MDVIQALVEQMTEHPEPCTLCRQGLIGPDNSAGFAGAVFFLGEEAVKVGAQPGHVRVVGWRVCKSCAKQFDSTEDMAMGCREQIQHDLGRPAVLQ